MILSCNIHKETLGATIPSVDFPTWQLVSNILKCEIRIKTTTFLTFESVLFELSIYLSWLFPISYLHIVCMLICRDGSWSKKEFINARQTNNITTWYVMDTTRYSRTHHNHSAEEKMLMKISNVGCQKTSIAPNFVP